VLIRPYESKIPDVFDAVVAACTAAFTGSDPQVFVRDGPWVGGEAGGAYVQDLVVGWYGFYPGYQYPTRSLSEELGEAVITGTNTQQGWGPSQEEEFTFGCASIVAVGHQPSTGEWSKLRRMAYGNIATAARYLADPENGQLYLNDTTEKLTIAASNAAHQVSQRRGLLCVVTFSIEGCTTSQQ
jgi:hypothetical protein